MRSAALLACISVTLTGQALQAPRFSEYIVKPDIRGKRAGPQVNLDDRDSAGWRAVLLDAEKPVNFAGRYVLSQDSCGSDSVLLMITNAATGHVFRGFCVYWDYLLRLDSRWPERRKSELARGLEFRLDSALLIAHGCWDSDKKPDCGDHYFKMTRHGLVPVQFVPFMPPRSPDK